MLEAINISHAFQRGTPFHHRVLDDVSLQLAQGEVILLTGPSGSGKTTLARILTGLEEPEYGAVHFHRRDIYRSKNKSSSKLGRVVMAFQYPERQFFGRTVLEELSWGLRVSLGMAESEKLRRLTTVSRDLNFPLDELAHRSPRSLSDGQKRKAALVSLLALEPQVLILDEPLAGLNARERRRLIILLRNWVNQNRAMIVITHEMELFLDWVDRVAILAAGRMIFSGSAAELYQTTDPEVLEAVALPPLIELSRYLIQRGLSDGPVSAGLQIVWEQFFKALARIKISNPK